MSLSRLVGLVGWGLAVLVGIGACSPPGASPGASAGAPPGAPPGASAGASQDASRAARQSAVVTTEPAEVHGSGATAPVAAPEPMPRPSQGQRQPQGQWHCWGPCLRWRAVLDDLDKHRERAYALGRPQLLRRVYVPGSQVLARDRRMLTDWIRRGATVSGVRLRVLHVHRLGGTRTGLRLQVIDRMTPATAQLRDGQRVALPRDLPTERVLVLTRLRAGWRIAASQ